MQAKRCDVLAVASGGGHWVQLMRLRSALDGTDVAYASSRPAKPKEISDCRYFVIREANRDTPLQALVAMLRVVEIVIRTRPRVIVTTGAAPGAFALLSGKLAGARTAWVDSIANVERVSLSGRLVRPFCDLWLTQWEHLAGPCGTEYRGRVI